MDGLCTSQVGATIPSPSATTERQRSARGCTLQIRTDTQESRRLERPCCDPQHQRGSDPHLISDPCLGRATHTRCLLTPRSSSLKYHDSRAQNPQDSGCGSSCGDAGPALPSAAYVFDMRAATAGSTEDEYDVTTRSETTVMSTHRS